VPGDPEHPQRTAIHLRGEEGLLAVGELDFHPGSYRVGVGSWRYSRRQPTLVDDAKAISWGSYGYLEWALSGDVLEGAGARAFVRGGVAADRVNRFSDFIGAGVVVDGSQWGADDECGFAVARAHNGSAYRDVQAAATTATDAAEVAFEFSYRLVVNEYIAVQPDLQYIIDPDTSPQLDDALIVGVRAELTLY
jgi:porin